MSILSPPAVSMTEDSTARAVRETLRGLLDKRCAPHDLLALISSGLPMNEALWGAVAGDLGLGALLVPEDFGGAGATISHVAPVLTELGRTLAPIPYLSSAVIATTALVHCSAVGSTGSGACAAGDVLGELAECSIAALAVPATHAPGSEKAPTVTGSADIGGTTRLSGSITRVVGTAGASHLLVPATLRDTPALVHVAADGPGVRIAPRTSIDLTRPTADIVLTDVAGSVLAIGDAATSAVRDALRTGAALLASEQVGICDWALGTAVEYLTIRHQFGRPIGSYQSLRHRAAQLWIDLNHARAAAMYAAGALTEGSADSDVATSMAKAYCSGVALHLVEEVLQMHGGIGFTWDHPIHLYLKRAFADAVILGDAETHRRILAGLVDIGEPTEQ